MFEVYTIFGPTGKVYVGLTSMGVAKRWCAHKKRAFNENKKHPLYSAIRKYGADAFQIQAIRVVETKERAASLEREFISFYRDFLGCPVYNLTDGGETDGAQGGKLFWARLNANPEERAAFIKKLSDTKKANDHTDYAKLFTARDEWVRNNRREAYYNGRRAIRIAANSRTYNVGHLHTEDARRRNGESQRKRWENAPESARRWHSRRSRINATRLWAERTAEEKVDVGAKISQGAKASFADPVRKSNNASQLAEARGNVDREKQGAAASKGLKEWWAALKADPVAYADHISRRRNSLKKTLEEKSKC